jgi:cell division septum initiation protein DivIVA
LRAAIPEEVRAAKRINSEGERIIEKANEEADRILARAQEQAAFLIGERGLTQSAEAESNRIVGQAENDADEVRRGADEYAVVRTLQGIKKGIAVLDERRAELRDEDAEADAAAGDQPDDGEYDAEAAAEDDETADAAPSGRR